MQLYAVSFKSSPFLDQIESMTLKTFNTNSSCRRSSPAFTIMMCSLISVVTKETFTGIALLLKMVSLPGRVPFTIVVGR